MTGPEHYREAERLLIGATGNTAVNEMQALGEMRAIALAQVHATLALTAVAVDIERDVVGPGSISHSSAWIAAVSS